MSRKKAFFYGQMSGVVEPIFGVIAAIGAMFIQNIIDFLIISFCIFLVVKTLNTLNDMTKKKLVKEEKVEKKEEEKVSEEILLLREINNSLKKQNKNAKKVKNS